MKIGSRQYTKTMVVMASLMLPLVASAKMDSEYDSFNISDAQVATITPYNDEFQIKEHDFTIVDTTAGLYDFIIEDASISSRIARASSESDELIINSNIKTLKAVLYRENRIVTKDGEIARADLLSESEGIVAGVNLEPGHYQLFVFADDNETHPTNAIPYKVSLVPSEDREAMEFRDAVRKKTAISESSEANAIAEFTTSEDLNSELLYVDSTFQIDESGRTYTLSLEEYNNIDWSSGKNNFNVFFGYEDDKGNYQYDNENYISLPISDSLTVKDVSAGLYIAKVGVQIPQSQDSFFYNLVLSDQDGNIVEGKEVVGMPSNSKVFGFGGIELKANTEYKIEFTSLSDINLDGIEFTSFDEVNEADLEIKLESVFASDITEEVTLRTEPVNQLDTAASTIVSFQSKPLSNFISISLKDLDKNKHYGVLVNIFENTTPSETDEDQVVWKPIYSNSFVDSPLVNGKYDIQLPQGECEIQVKQIVNPSASGAFYVLALGPSGVMVHDVKSSSSNTLELLGGNYSLYPLVSQDTASVYSIAINDISNGLEQKEAKLAFVDIAKPFRIAKGNLNISDAARYEVKVMDTDPLSSNLPSDEWGVVVSQGAESKMLSIGELKNIKELEEGDYQILLYKRQAQLSAPTLFNTSFEEVINEPLGSNVVANKDEGGSGNFFSFLMWSILLLFPFFRKVSMVTFKI